MANSHKLVARADAHAPGEVTDYMLLDEQGSDPATPAATKWVWYVKSGGVYAKNAAGTVVGPFGAVAAAPGTPASGKLRLYAKTGKVLAVKDDAGVETVLGAGGGAPATVGASYARTSANYTTTSGTFVDIDGTNLALTIVTGAHQVLIGLSAMGEIGTGGETCEIDVL